jgi:sugar phosphate isomerase/epimerase
MKMNLAWLYAITKYGYPPPINKIFNVIDDMKNLGFNAIELEVYTSKNLLEFEEKKEEIKKYIKDLDLKVINLAAVLPELLDSNEDIRKKGIEYFKRSIDLAIFFESPMIQTDTFTPPLKFEGKAPYKGAIVFGEKYKVIIDKDFSWKKFWKILVETMKKCAKAAKKNNLLFTIEPRIGETISNTDAMLKLLEEVNEENFGAVLDCGHLNAAKEIIPLSIEKLGEKIMYVHASDNDGRDNYHFAPGKGTIDWDGVFQALKKHKFNGYVAIDVGGEEIKNRLNEEVLEAKNFLEKLFEKYGL